MDTALAISTGAMFAPWAGMGSTSHRAQARQSRAALSQGLNSSQGAKWKVWQRDKAGRAGSGAEAPSVYTQLPAASVAAREAGMWGAILPTRFEAGMLGGILPSWSMAGRGCARALCSGLALKPGGAAVPALG